MTEIPKACMLRSIIFALALNCKDVSVVPGTTQKELDDAVNCIGSGCGHWSTQKEQCGLIHD